ncbi:Hsp70 family protein [Pleionea sediminis]|uniref:Hsp70 family protein n=1 Tax=Pleionea sediminis TaxID=2569479 RepID=UPI0011847C60|nr:Hsp70 family protein [Pleionea sediminis]
MIYLGIDLGTTYSLAAYVNEQGIPVLIPDSENIEEYRTPSVIHIGPDGALLGQVLTEFFDEEPGAHQVRFFKLNLGETQCVYQDHQHRNWRPEALSALVLKKLLNDVENFVQENIEGVVITVPANFNDKQRRATRSAASLAGIKHVKLVEEPVAAATYYGMDIAGDQTLFVYDLGGGTFDATILQTGESGLFALATEGNNQLGGKHVDEIIMQDILAEFKRNFGYHLTETSHLVQLRNMAHEIKLELVQPSVSKVNRTLVLAGETLDFILTRTKFDSLIDQFVENTLSVCQSCLSKAGLEWEFIDQILLTGGSSLLPLVSEKLAATCGKSREELICRQPHQAVAYGAAVLAQQLYLGAHKKKVQTISSQALGIRVKNSDGQPSIKTLIEQNTPLPAQEKLTFYTNRADQKRLIIEVVQTQGVTEESLGYFAFAIEKPRLNYPIDILLSYDIEGIVTVTATDPETGHEFQQVMDDAVEALDNQLLEQQKWVRDIRINYQ